MLSPSSRSCSWSRSSLCSSEPRSTSFPVTSNTRAITAVAADIQSIYTQLKLYESMNGFYPTTEQGLRGARRAAEHDPQPQRWSQLFKELPKDPWHNNYIYISPGRKNPERLRSLFRRAGSETRYARRRSGAVRRVRQGAFVLSLRTEPRLLCWHAKSFDKNAQLPFVRFFPLLRSELRRVPRFRPDDERRRSQH